MFKWFLYLLVAYLAYEDVLGKKHDRHHKNIDGKIVGGNDTTIQNAPYQVYLIVQRGMDYYQCGGSIVNPRYVLTAAHCLTGVSLVYARVGSTNSQEGGRLYSTRVYTVHPRYNAATSDYDVAVVRFLRNITLDGTSSRAISLAPSGTEVAPGTILYVTGWGTTTENGNTSTTLMEVRVPVVSTSDCQRSYNSQITPRMLCAGLPEGGKDSCQGDSGGPAVDDGTGVQVGIVSFGTGCARRGYPGVYANVSNVRGWIDANTRF